MRNNIFIKINNSYSYIIKLVNYFKTQKEICLLNSNSYKQYKYSKYECVFATLPNKILKIKKENVSPNCFEQLKNFYNEVNDWIFGHLSYDLKNCLENITSNNIDIIKAPVLNFFQPAIIFFIEKKTVKISYLSSYFSKSEVLNLSKKINQTPVGIQKNFKKNIYPTPRVARETFLLNIQKIKKHIQLGNIYEMNYCQEFYKKNINIDPFATYLDLITISPTPFSCYYKTKNTHLICASPERFLKKNKKTIIAQPIKGTIQRGGNKKEDKLLQNQLKNSQKDQSENVMIVDLVRNDLSKIAKKGSIKVDELFKIYAFKQVFQMISTIICKSKQKHHPVDIIQHAFPMGSMTGAPKLKAMQLIEFFESTKRGIYSGAVGYIDPFSNFDFNVVIRSILYNQKHQNLSYMVGGAITIESEPINEYEECLIKAKAILKTLNKNLL